MRFGLALPSYSFADLDYAKAAQRQQQLNAIADSAAPGLTTTDLGTAQKTAQATADAIGAAK